MSENKGYIKIPISEVWEIINRPHRLLRFMYEEVEKLPIGHYEYLEFDEETKRAIIKRLKDIDDTGSLYGRSQVFTI